MTNEIQTGSHRNDSLADINLHAEPVESAERIIGPLLSEVVTVVPESIRPFARMAPLSDEVSAKLIAANSNAGLGVSDKRVNRGW